jgi:ureidoglycolate lyase
MRATPPETSMRLTAEPLTTEAFAPFGEVLAAPAAPGRVHAEGALANRRAHAKPSLYFTCKEPSALPLASKVMERHLHSSQSFVPMEAGRWLVVVAPHGADGGPDVWHHPFTVLDRTARFAVFMWKDGGPEDDEFVDVAPFEVVVPPQAA